MRSVFSLALFGFMATLSLREAEKGQLAQQVVSEQRERVVRFKSNKGSHLCSTKRLLYTKALDLGGLFVFLGVKNSPLSPLHLFLNLLDSNLRLVIDKYIEIFMIL